MSEIKIPEAEFKWVEEQSIKHELDPTEMKEIYTKEFEVLVESGLADEVESEEELFEWSRSIVNKKIQQEAGVPKKEFDFLALGNFGVKKRSGEKLVSELIGWLKDPENEESKPLLSLITLWDDDVYRRTEIDFASTYTTKFAFSPEYNERTDRYNVSLRDFSKFTSKELSWLPSEHKETIKKIRQLIPVTKIADAEENQTCFEENNGSTYPDKTDIRRIKGTVVNYKSGTKKDGSTWAKYGIVDSSFEAEEGKPHSFTVWIDNALAEKYNAGKDSLVEIYGIIKSSSSDEEIMEMDACAIYPLIVKNEIGKPSEKIKAKKPPTQRQTSSTFDLDESDIDGETI